MRTVFAVLVPLFAAGCGCGAGKTTGGSAVDGGGTCEPVNDVEECNGRDDNCDGRVDEGIDLDTDPFNCGACLNNCDFSNADATCEGGACVMGDCLDDYYDLDGDRLDGCEYRCSVDRPTETEENCTDGLDDDCDGLVDTDEDPDCGGCVPEICDGKDNDCNEAIDETFDFQNDPQNCGECGNLCEFDHANADCCEGRCCIQDCEGDWVDANDIPDDGCECEPSGSPETDCDGLDDDCDGLVDEDYVPYPCGLGACQNDSTCVGGIEDCTPGDPALDVPDDAFLDLDCDGIDGDESDGIFVSVATGNDANDGTRDNPVRTISQGLALAVDGGQHALYVSVGTYSQGGVTLNLVEGISIYGGYNHATDWSRSSSNIAILSGGVKAIAATNVVADTRLDLLTLRSANASSAGSSSYVVFATGSDGLEVSNCAIEAGNGRAGTSGVDGTVGDSGDPGTAGEPGCEDSGGFCTSCGRPQGGPGGSSSCARTGGIGGNAGHGDGAGADGATGTGGTAGGLGGPGGGFGDGGNGSPGANGSNGTNGARGVDFGIAAIGGYTPSGGVNGTNGGDGNAGGGGGGGGGGVADCDSYGSSGGGGGGGACNGTYGTAGGGGGGSFAIYLWNSDVTVRNCSSIESGIGGDGGDAGDGALGGTGGTGGPGGPYGGGSEQDDGGMGGDGGRGGNGGRGGHGGGGGGGPSVCIYVGGDSVLDELDNVYVVGSGGSGGISTGNDGLDGFEADVFDP
jgi:hypothetical protein